MQSPPLSRSQLLTMQHEQRLVEQGIAAEEGSLRQELPSLRSPEHYDEGEADRASIFCLQRLLLHGGIPQAM